MAGETCDPFPVILMDRNGEPLQRRGGRPEYREAHRLIEAGAPVLEVSPDRPRWVEDAPAWWQENAQQVETKDHPAAGPWPQHAAYTASVWSRRLGASWSSTCTAK